MASTADSVFHCEKARRLSASPKSFNDIGIKGATRLSGQTDEPYWCPMRATAAGYSKLCKSISDGDVEGSERLIREGIDILARAFETLENPVNSKRPIVDLTLIEIFKGGARTNTSLRAFPGVKYMV